jgi:GTPase
LIVINKADAAAELSLVRLRHLLPGAVVVSARTGEGVAELVEAIAERLPRPEVTVDALVPYTRGELVARVHDDGEVLTEEHLPEGTRLSARVRPELASALEAYAVNGSPA